MSPGRRSRANSAVTWWARIASCTWTAPFGLPVVPLVKCSRAGSSGRVGATVKVSGSYAAAPAPSATDLGTVGTVGIGEQDVPEVGERVPVRLHLAEVRRCVGHEDADVAEAQSLEHRLGTERREERTVDGTGLEGAEDREVELGRPRQERADAVAGTDAQTAEGGRRDVALVAQLRVGQLGRGGGAGQEADRDRVGELALRVPVDRLVGHVEVALPVTLQPRPRRLPAEGAPSRLVVADERRQRGHVLDRSPLPGAAVHCQVAHGTTVPRASRRQVGTNGPVSR